MIVTVNGQRVDVTLEKERTLGEFLGGMESWLEESQCSLSGFSIDGKEITPDKIEECCADELDGVERVDLIAASWNELFKKAAAVAAETLERCAAERENARARGAQADSAAVAAAFLESPAASFLDGFAPELGALAGRALACAGADPAADLAAAAAVLKERIAEMESPLAELEAERRFLGLMAERLEALPLELQTGKDAQAAYTLRDFSLGIGKLLRLIPILKGDGILLESLRVGDVPFKEYVEDLNAALRELNSAFENGDAVLVGDLAEYELAPRVRDLAEALAAAAPV